MARTVRGLDIPMIVSANATSIGQYRACSVDASGNAEDVIYPAGNTTLIVGVNQDSGGPPTPGGTIVPASTPGQEINVRIQGITKWEAGAAVSVNTAISVDSSGRAVSATAAAATSTYIHGLALEAATAAGDLITVLMYPNSSQIVNA